MKSGKLRIALGIVLVLLQLISLVCFNQVNEKLFDEKLPGMYYTEPMDKDAVLTPLKCAIGFLVGNEKFTHVVEVTIRKLEDKWYYSNTTLEYVSVSIRQSFGAGEVGLYPLLFLYDLCILIGYYWYGILGVILLCIGIKQKSMPETYLLPVDRIDTRKTKIFRILMMICSVLLLLVRAKNTYISSQHWIGAYEKYLNSILWMVVWSVPYIMIAIFCVFCLGRRKSVLLSGGLMFFGIAGCIQEFLSLLDDWVYASNTETSFASMISWTINTGTYVALLYLGVQLYVQYKKRAVRAAGICAMVFLFAQTFLNPLITFMVYPEYGYSISVRYLLLLAIVFIYLYMLPSEPFCCPYCRVEMGDADRFCRKCGRKPTNSIR